MTTLSQDSRSPGRDLNPRPSEYEMGVLTIQLQPYVTLGLVLSIATKTSNTKQQEYQVNLP
jgi:hypothetical protein